MKVQKTRMLATATALCALCAVGASPEITSVAVLQQWPWNAKINVDFHLANDESIPVDVSLAVSNGTSSITVPVRAVTGRRIGLSATGDYRLVIDTARMTANGMTVLGDFSVTLSLLPSRADADFPLYKIYDLSARTVTNVTVKALLEGEWGDIETDYSFAGGTYAPSDVLIWTGVTNNPAYKTDKLVMRYVPSGYYTMLAQKSPPGTGMTLTEPFYVGVFEMTQGQCSILNSERAKAYYTNETFAAMRPMGSLTWSNIRGETSRDWPQLTNPGAASYIGRLRSFMNESSFDLPTEARWEYAARAGCAAGWYNGAASPSEDMVSSLCRYSGNGGLLNGAGIPTGDVSTENGTAVVGSYLPNAWGLYDCIGNVAELCLDRMSSASGVVNGGPYVDWVGSDTDEKDQHIVRGGYYGVPASELRVDWREQARFSNNYTSGKSDFKDRDLIGFRVVCSATAAPSVSEGSIISSATAYAAESISLTPDASLFWRTARADRPIPVSIDWPDGAATATCSLTVCGQISASHVVSRAGNAPGTVLVLELPMPVTPDDERVYWAELSFVDSNGVTMAAATRRAQFATVLGCEGSGTVVRKPDSSRWMKYNGSHVTLPVAAGVSSIVVDGATVDTGLNDAMGWFGTVLSSGEHTLSIDQETRTIICKASGLIIIFR